MRNPEAALRPTDGAKEKRLRLLAKRAGDLSVEAYLGGNRGRAEHFLNKMKRILWLVWVGVQGE